ncbi:hypothetical protein [Algibacillus agarilyticus]|uniref:hypothetical protein n=1 Tax=Algibacillus agarilyticus TaxID=2234133 RepID=UPI000DCFDFFD|nr:hypothetical protein [Algibacillus agarilyticus]
MYQLLELKPTTAVDLFFMNAAHKKVRARAEYIGCISKQFLMFRMPKTRESRDLMLLKPGVSLTVRAVINSERMDYVIFNTAVQALTTYKETILVLDFPEDVKTQKLRTQPRLRIELMAELEIINHKIKLLALITDISLSGCKCECLPVDGSALSELKLDTLDLLDKPISLITQFDPLSESNTQLTANIKNMTIKEKLHMGLKFDTATQDTFSPIYMKMLMDVQGVTLEE